MDNTLPVTAKIEKKGIYCSMNVLLASRFPSDPLHQKRIYTVFMVLLRAGLAVFVGCSG